MGLGNEIMDISSDGTVEGDDTGQSSFEKANRPRQRDVHHDGERVAWSDEDIDADTAYKDFKNRKALKRKRAVASTKKAKAAVAAASAVASSMVGRRPKKVRRVGLDEPDPRARNTYASDSADDSLIEEELPDYLKSRKALFEKHRETLGQLGLKLPPSFDGIDFSEDESLGHLREKPAFDTEPCAPYRDKPLRYSLGVIPAAHAQWLREYQVEGVAFLHELFVYQRGGILGDDMGLGKTIQVIAFLTVAFGKTADERDMKRMRKMRNAPEKPWYPKVLIVCPGSLMENWKNEFATWGWWHIYMYHGSTETKEAALHAAENGRLEVMITTYATYRLNKDAINMVEWDCVVADECHNIKERGSEITIAMNEVNSLCRIGLTGTAIQNKYEELWTILNWTNPGKFGPLSSWKACISEPLKIGQSHDATIPQLATARKTAKKLVQNLLPQFFLRRMKSLISHQLPKKSDRVVFCPMTDTQTQAYENFCDSEVTEYIRDSADPCDCGSGKKRGWCCYMDIPGFGKWQNHVFPCIQTLQKISNHLAILIPLGTDSPEKQEKDLENLRVAMPDQWQDLYRKRDNILNFANQDFCGKWKIIKKLLRFWHASGDKVLVFSHSVRLLKMLHMLFSSTTSYTVSYLDGSLSYPDRQRVVDDFNADPAQFVFLISSKAGGVGLNITAANKVIIVDPNWNPAYDLQAQDRAYRIGQRRDVEVFRLISAGTIEEIVYARQIYKQQQANIGYNASAERRYFKGVQDTKEKKGEIFGLRNMLSYQGEHLVLRDIVNKTNVAESKAGVQVVGLDLQATQDNDQGDSSLADVGEGEDAAMSQIAAMITAQAEKKAERQASKAKRADPVLAILAQAGVEYTHENSEVIGSSKIETRLSKKAEEAGNDIEARNEVVFAKSQSQNQPDFEDSGYEEDGEDRFAGVKYKYKPPKDVMKRQFCTMAETFGFSDPTEFALVVEGWTQAQRRNCLEKFYRIRRAKLAADDG